VSGSSATPPASQALKQRLLHGGSLLVVGMVSLPVLGMYFAYIQPPGLIEPPPIQWQRVGLLLGRTLGLATLVSAASLLLGTVLGYAQARTTYRGRALLSVLSVLPLAVPSYLIAAIVRESMAPNSPLGSLLGTDSAFSGFWPAVLVLTVACTPYVQLLVAAALQRFPAAEEEAARSLGASSWRRFRALLVPRLRPTWSFALVLVALYVISDFGAVAVLDCRVLTWELYQARGARDAVVLAFAIMAAVIPMLTVIRLLAGEARPERQLGKGRSPSHHSLSRRALAVVYLAHAGIIGLGVLLPLLSLGSWVQAGFAHGVAFAPLGEPIFNTALFTLTAASFTLVCAFLPAWVVARSPKVRGRGVMENMTYLTSAVPGVLLAFGLLHLLLGLKRHLPLTLGGESAWGALEGAGLVLLLGYMMRFLAQGYAALKPAILALDVRQEESAKSLGASTNRRMWQVTLPALGPGIRAAFLLLFLSVAKELPLTLMLTPLGKQTLAYRIFDAQQEASLADVGAAGLLLMIFALGMQLVLLNRRVHA
jgi:iron(III) transport system permease protein